MLLRLAGWGVCARVSLRYSTVHTRAVAAALFLVSAVSLLSLLSLLYPSTVCRLCHQALAHFNQVLVLWANYLRPVVRVASSPERPLSTT